MQLWLPLFTIFAYVAAAAGFVRVYRKPLRRINPLWVLGILVCACQGHALSLIVSLQANGHLNLSIFNMVSVNAWFVACISVFWLWPSPCRSFSSATSRSPRIFRPACGGIF